MPDASRMPAGPPAPTATGPRDRRRALLAGRDRLGCGRVSAPSRAGPALSPRPRTVSRGSRPGWACSCTGQPAPAASSLPVSTAPPSPALGPARPRTERGGRRCGAAGRGRTPPAAPRGGGDRGEGGKGGMGLCSRFGAGVAPVWLFTAQSRFLHGAAFPLAPHVTPSHATHPIPHTF